MALLICRTCPRYDARRTGGFGRRFAAAVGALTDADPDRTVTVRAVHCLGGCPDDGVVALAGHGLARVRFTHIDETDADAVLTAAAAHEASPTGVPGEWPVPAALAGRISAVTRTWR